ncbi:radical SAM protein [Sphingomonas gilva]|uniref:Radical SAM protein n=2 Tax=Sphingomonas gilva TaxID=2305907 RepID=A0A396RVQ8_9SPHN|nr:radical SAM protein [Sphingomonas gilva]
MRLAAGRTADDDAFLHSQGHLAKNALARHARMFTRAQRQTQVSGLDYLILVPTLRCNLACAYCQVSHAAEHALNYDWSAETLEAVNHLVSTLNVPVAKIEFQGGEPTLRPDLIRAVMAAAPATTEITYVICTNLQVVDDAMLEIFDRPDVQISTSLDGDFLTHVQQRQGDEAATMRFLANLDFLLQRYGPDKISALPTIDPRSPPTINALIETYASRGFNSIYLRPINYQGFARKRHPHARTQNDDWRAYHTRFIEALILRNWENRAGRILEESYFSHILRRIFRPGEDRHVDLRNPNPMGRDYVVIDHDGRVYPTDEARMLSRSGIIDLSIGDVFSGWNTPARAALDAASTNAGDPACEACAYQPYCGRDLVDDIARYGRIDLPRHETEFCRRHMHLFDLAFRLIYSPDEATQYSLRCWLGLAGDSVRLGLER